VGVGVEGVGGAEDLVGAGGRVDGAGLVVVPSLLLVGWWVADEVDDAERGDGLGASVEGVDSDDALADVVASGELGAGDLLPGLLPGLRTVPGPTSASWRWVPDAQAATKADPTSPAPAARTARREHSRSQIPVAVVAGDCSVGPRPSGMASSCATREPIPAQSAARGRKTEGGRS
jgi:hypothetical protein